ncbi:MAG: hypothetical protein JW806_00710 [Sedimentisphaerales bacterium]|nr:hypothetical protein [Sedimentisphaerales bacterium]
MRQRFLGIITIIILLASINAFSAPQPSIVPRTNQWTLNVVFDQPQQITVKVPGQSKAQRFWYIIVTLTNNSDIDVPFYPTCEMMTDTFQILGAYHDSENAVFNKIKRRHKKKYPLLESIWHTDSRILQGQDNTKDLVIIWPDFEARAKNISLFLAGMSNETVSVEHPIDKDENGEPLKLYLRKTLELQYSIGGDEKLRSSAKLAYKGKRWVMR